MVFSHRAPLTHFRDTSRTRQFSRRTFLEGIIAAAMSCSMPLTSRAVTAVQTGYVAENVQNALLSRTTPPPPVDITTFFPELASLARQTVRLHPRLGAEPGPGESKIGGTFLWPDGEPWPCCPVGHVHSEPRRSQDAELLRWEAGNAEWWRQTLPDLAQGRPAGQPHGSYVGILQLYAADIPELGFPQGCDLFQLLWCPRNHDHFPNFSQAGHDWWGPVCRIYWRDSRTIAMPCKENPVPTVFTPGFVPHVCQLFPEQMHDYPILPNLPASLQERIVSWEATEAAGGYDYDSHLSVPWGIKIGGNTLWASDDEFPSCASCQQSMEHLVTICSAEWDDKARWRPREDQALIDDGSMGNQQEYCPTGLDQNECCMLVFVCRRCPDWPTAYFQMPA